VPIGVKAAAATLNVKYGQTTQNRQRSDINGGSGVGSYGALGHMSITNFQI